MSSGASILNTLHSLAIGRLPGPIVVAEQAVDTYARGFDEQSQVIALDTILRDLARLRAKDPRLDPFLSEVEQYIGALQHDLALALSGGA